MENPNVDLFDSGNLSGLRADLLQSGLDSWQAGEVLSAYLSGRGFGISHDDARSAVTRIESVGCSLHSLREELSRLALVN